MTRHRLWIYLVLVFCAHAVGAGSSGQSLSVKKVGAKDYWLEAAAPEGGRYVLQASANLDLWVDIDDEVSGVVSNRLDMTGVTQRYFRLAPWTEPAEPIRLALVGDSTVASGIGWGDAMSHYFRENVQYVNLAQSRFSTKIFLASEQRDHMVAIRPDYVLLEFGLIDWVGCSDDAARCGTTLVEYEVNLRTIIQMVRDFGGTPILITPASARDFDAQGRVSTVMEDRAGIMRRLAVELETPLIDLHRLSAELFAKLGASGSEYLMLYPATDPFHFSPIGREVISSMVANELPGKLGPYLKNIFDNPAGF